jgi:hypothetical protein
MRKYLYLLFLIGMVGCEDNVIQEDEYVLMRPEDLLGKYVVNYQMYWSYGDQYNESTLENHVDTFEMKLIPDSSKLTWRSLTPHQSFQFDVPLEAIPLEIKQYKRVSIPMWGENVEYKGTLNTSGQNWKIFPYERIADEVVWSAFIKDVDLGVCLAGSSLQPSFAYYHFKAGAYASTQASFDMRFRIISCTKIPN